MAQNPTKLEEIIEKTHTMLESMEVLLSNKTNFDYFPDLINNGIKIFEQFPFTESVSIFLLNEENFELEHRATTPYSFKYQNIDLYFKLLDEGIIGNTLEVGDFTIYPENSGENTEFALLLPLANSNGINGLFLLRTRDNPYKFDALTSRVIKNITNFFASKLENLLLSKRLEKAYSTLEQKVAMRTMNLAQSKRELQAIFNSVQTGILVVDIETNKVLNANFVALNLIDEMQENVIGKPAANFFKISDKEKQILQDQVQFSGNFESFLKTSTGICTPILKTISNINLGSHKYRIESFIDITERKNAELALQNTNELLELKVAERTEDLQILIHRLKEEIDFRKHAEEELLKAIEKEKELSELKTRFVTMVSHEFRTPMTIISSSAQMNLKFKEKLSDEEKDSYLNRILSTVDYMGDLLENVIFMGKSDSNKVTSSPQPLHILDFCKKIIQDIKFASKTSSEINLYPDLKLETVNLDEKLMRHIIINLLSNAIKYTLDGKPVEFFISSDDSQVSIIIKDYGIGIPDNAQQKIYEQFYRADNVGAVSGTGLGMSVILRSLELLNGKIELSSKEKFGSTFSVTIPLNSPNQ